MNNNFSLWIWDAPSEGEKIPDHPPIELTDLVSKVEIEWGDGTKTTHTKKDEKP